MFYDRRGKEIRLNEYGDLIRHLPYRLVENSEVSGQEISTIWDGFNFNPFGEPPLIFETSLFALEPNRELICVLSRYPTEEAAIIGHKFWCQSIAEGWEVKSRWQS